MEYKISHAWEHSLIDELLTIKNGGGININSIVNNNVIVCHPHTIQPSCHMTNKQSIMNHHNSQEKQFDTSPYITNHQHPYTKIYDTSLSITKNSVWVNQ